MSPVWIGRYKEVGNWQAAMWMAVRVCSALSCSALAAAAALLVTPTYLAKFDMGEGLGTKAFFAAIIGGFNNSRGALLGGLIVGVCENLAAAYVSSAYKDAVALAIFMLVILFKPQGLLGRKEERKV